MNIRKFIKRFIKKESLFFKLACWLSHAYYYVISRIFSLCPIGHNKIVFDNFSGAGYGAQPMQIAEELLKKNSTYELVWLSRDANIKVPEGIRVVSYYSWQACYEMATAKIWIDNVRNSTILNLQRKRKKQVYIQTWHAGCWLKKVEGDVENILPPKYVKEAKYNSTLTDVILTENRWMEKLVQNSFWYSGKTIPVEYYGVVDEGKKQNASSRVRYYFGLSESARFFLYAPTFRNNFKFEYYDIDIEKIRRTLSKQFGGVWYALIRLHPGLKKNAKEFPFKGDFIDASDYPDMTELINAADVYITDYSSPMFEAFRNKKVCFLFTVDYDFYCQNERGVYFNMEDLPAQIAHNNIELIQNIINFDKAKYDAACDRFNSEIGYNSSERNLDELITYIHQNTIEK